MVNVNSIERDKQQIIKNFNPKEMEAYLKSLVNLYYMLLLFILILKPECSLSVTS